MGNCFVNILSLHIFVEPTEGCRIPLSDNVLRNAPEGLLKRASQQMNLGKHLEQYAETHPPKCEHVNAFYSDIERTIFFKRQCSVTTWYNYFEFGGLGFRYNVLVELDRCTYLAAEATREQGMPIELGLVDLK